MIKKRTKLNEIQIDLHIQAYISLKFITYILCELLFMWQLHQNIMYMLYVWRVSQNTQLGFVVFPFCFLHLRNMSPMSDKNWFIFASSLQCFFKVFFFLICSFVSMDYSQICPCIHLYLKVIEKTISYELNLFTEVTHLIKPLLLCLTDDLLIQVWLYVIPESLINSYLYLSSNLLSTIWLCIKMKMGPWPWSFGSWIYNYLCNQCLSPLELWVRTPFIVRCTRYNIMW